MGSDVEAILAGGSREGNLRPRSLGDSYNQQPKTPEPAEKSQHQYSSIAIDGHRQPQKPIQVRQSYPPRIESPVSNQYATLGGWAGDRASEMGRRTPPSERNYATATDMPTLTEPLVREQPLIPDKASLSLYIQQLTAKDIRLRQKLKRSLLQEIES